MFLYYPPAHIAYNYTIDMERSKDIFLQMQRQEALSEQANYGTTTKTHYELMCESHQSLVSSIAPLLEAMRMATNDEQRALLHQTIHNMVKGSGMMNWTKNEWKLLVEEDALVFSPVEVTPCNGHYQFSVIKKHTSNHINDPL